MSYKSARWARKPSGHFFMDGEEVADTLQCCHCNAHIAFTGDSSVGMCRGCMKPTCGKPRCEERCFPFEKRLDLYEKHLIGRL